MCIRDSHYPNNNYNPNINPQYPNQNFPNQNQNQNYNQNNFNPNQNQEIIQPINSFDKRQNDMEEPLTGHQPFNPYDTQGGRYPDMNDNYHNIPQEEMENHETFDLKSKKK